MDADATELRELLHERAAGVAITTFDADSIIELAQTQRRRKQRARAGGALVLVAAGIVATLVAGVGRSETPASLIPATISPQPQASTQLNDEPSLPPLPKGWIAAPAGPLPVQYSIGVRVGGEIVYWGGRNGTSYSLPSYDTKGAVFDVAHRHWSVMAASPLSDRTTMATAGNDGSYFVWGGSATGLGYFDDGAVYDVAANTWKLTAPAPLKAQPILGAVWNGSEFVVIAEPGFQAAGAAAAYNPATNTWRRLPTLPALPEAAHLLLVSGKIVVFGADVSYELSADSAAWTEIASPVNMEPATLTFASEGDYAYAVGRLASQTAAAPTPLSFQRFSFAAGVWDVRAAPPFTASDCPPTVAMTTKEVFLGYCRGNALFNRAGQFWVAASDSGAGQPVAIGSQLVFYFPGTARTVIYTGP